LGVAEVNFGVGRDREASVVSEFHAAIPSQRCHNPLWQLLHLPNKGVDDAGSILAFNVNQHHKARLPFNQGCDVGILAA